MTIDLANIAAPNRLQQLVGKLSEASRETYYNVYDVLDWPETLPTDQYWMSPELLSVFHTDVFDQLDEEQRIRLSHYECSNFFSLNVHGIRELIAEVTWRIHTPSFRDYSEFLHHFIDEENKHMWFFATTCNRYGKLYPDRSMPFESREEEAFKTLLAFAKVVLFEEIVDYYNVHMSTDKRLPVFLQELNKLHHRDESRHVAFGRELVVSLYKNLEQVGGGEVAARARKYLRDYTQVCLEKLYNPAVYTDAALGLDPYALRRELLAHPARLQFHGDVLKRTNKFLDRIGMALN